MGTLRPLLWLCLFYLYTGSAQDNENPSLKQSEIIDNNIDQQLHLPKERYVNYQENHKPMFNDCALYNPQVKEEQSRGTYVIQVKAIDSDPPNSPGGRITYSIEQQPNSNPQRIFFTINNETGEVFTAMPFDRDEPTRHKELYLSVRAEDNGRPQLADICTFKVTVTDINDNSPSFDQVEYSAEVSEDLPENSEVLRVSAYDFDDGENARLTYSFSNSNNQFDEYFRIDESTGVVYLKKRLTGNSGTKYSSTVIVRDNGEKQHQAPAEINLTVVDSNRKSPTITVDNNQQTIELPEDLHDFERHLVTITADSHIPGKGVAFELVRGKTTQTNKDQTFALNPDGNFSAHIYLKKFLDYETVTEYQLTVRARNTELLYSSVTINVQVKDVNDETPSFIEILKGSVVENDQAGAQVMTVRAVDEDGTSPNNKVVYELMTHKDLFDIDPNSGVITSKVPFDREEEKLYHVTVQARDSAPSAILADKRPNSSNQTFQISIEDQNDNHPHFTKSIYVVYNISENADRQDNVVEVKANDEDTASLIIYSIIEGNIDDAFIMENTTGRIKVKNSLDFEKVESYNLTVRAFDGIYEDTAKVFIHILNVNDEVPVFEDYNKTINIKEETTSNGECIIRLKAYDPDIKNRSAYQNIVYRVGDNYQHFLSVDDNGCVVLTKELDRDLPNGSPSYQAFINAFDNGGGPGSLYHYAEINITLEDINDNAPYLDMTDVVWYENQSPGHIVTLKAQDNDGPNNGPPFTFEIAPSASFEITEKFEVQDSELSAKVTFDREEQKFYDVPIKITDSGVPTQSDISILRVIIGDRNDNAAQDGSSEIFVYKYEGLMMNTNIGRVYVNDPDDWDLPDKEFQFDGPPPPYFDVDRRGMITMKKDAVPNEYQLNFVVTEDLPNSTLNRVRADVTVTVKGIPEEAVRKSGSIRINKTSIEEFIQKDPLTSMSKKDILQKHMAKLLNTSLENVDIFTVMPSANNSLVDVRFSAHGSPYYAPERLNNKATEEQDKLEQELGVEFIMISINECLQPNSCPKNGSCSNVLAIKEEPAVVFTNKTSFVGVKAVAEAVCECRKRIVAECFNGGTPIEDGRCNCPDGTEGPNCEILGVSFAGDGWAMYPSFDSCASTFISLSVLPQTDNGLIFYVGPLTKRHARVSRDFMSVELREGFVVLKVDLGGVTEEFKSEYKQINDGANHRIKINYTISEVQIEVDECPSDCIKWAGFKKGGLLKLNGPLQVGGRSNIFAAEEAKTVWNNPPTSSGFKGCITNFTYNNYLYNLGAPSDKYRAHGGTCNYGMFQAATFGIDSNFLVAILVCLAILLILLLAVVVHKRKQDNLNEKDIDDTRETIINYEDEGGGESDTNFDLSVLRNNMDEKPPMKDNLYKQAADVPADIGSFLDDKKRACDKDNLPCDDVRHYGYEGDGNSSGSLSSLASCTDEGDLKFNYLSSFGPRFRKLADMYGDDASEEGSQNGGEESWC